VTHPDDKTVEVINELQPEVIIPDTSAIPDLEYTVLM
jgi:hypothetical protein